MVTQKFQKVNSWSFQTANFGSECTFENFGYVHIVLNVGLDVVFLMYVYSGESVVGCGCAVL